MSETAVGRLAVLTAEIEEFVAAGGWDAPPVLFALVPTAVLAADPTAATVLGRMDPADALAVAAEALTPIAQEVLPDGPLDEALAQIGWPPEVSGCALSQEIVMVPATAEASLTDLSDADAAQAALMHADRREARLVVAVLRDGSSTGLLRLRATAHEPDELLVGDNLAPNLAAALAHTLQD